MSPRLPSLLISLLTIGVVGWPLSAGAQPAPSAVVPVNVRVFDKAGKPVTDLKASDFSLIEDGVPQTVRSCTAITMTAGAIPDPALPPRKGLSSAAVPTGRTFLIVLGLGRLEEPSRSISGLLRFVKSSLLPQDVVGLFAYDRALPFSTDHQKVVAALERLKKAHEDIDFELTQQLGPTGMASLYGKRVLSKKIQAKIDDAVLGPGAKPVEAFTGETIDRDALDAMSLDAFAVSAAVTLQDEDNLAAVLEYLRRFEGEKHVLFVTEKGFLWPSEENDRALAMAANDARASIHPIQAGGLLAATENSSTKEMTATLQQALSFRSLRRISDLSGGLPAIMEKGQAALDRLDEATRGGYLLGFQSSNAAFDGAYRNLVVRVNRPDVTVTWRHGYHRSAEVGSFNRRAFITGNRLSAAANFRREVSDLKVKTSVSQKGGTSLSVTGRIEIAKAKALSVDGGRVGQFDIAVYGFDSGANPTGTYVQTLPFKLSEEDYTRALKDGLPYTIEFPIIRGTQNVRFVVYDYGSDLIGRADVRVF